MSSPTDSLPALDAPNVINEIKANHDKIKEIYADKRKSIPYEGLIEDFNQAINKLISQVKQQKELWNADPNPNHAFGYKWLIELIEVEIEECRKQIMILNWQIKKLEGKIPEGKLTDEDIKTARAVPIQKLIPGKQKDRGKRIYIICPFHTDHSPSGVIYTDQNSFSCYACNTFAGDVIEFVMKRDKLGFVDAVKYLLGFI